MTESRGLGEIVTFRYPPKVIVADYIRAGVGLALCGFPLTLPLANIARWILGPLVLCFMVYFLLTLRRQLTVFECAAETLSHRVGGRARRRTYAWLELTGLQLAYFSVRRDGEAGWLQLRLEFADDVVRLDSRLDAFESLLQVALERAERANLELDTVTLSNLSAMGWDKYVNWDPSVRDE